MNRLLLILWSLGPMLWQLYTSFRPNATLTGPGIKDTVRMNLPDVALMQRRIFASSTRSPRPQNLIQMVNLFVNLCQSLPGWPIRISSAHGKPRSRF